MTSKQPSHPRGDYLHAQLHQILLLIRLLTCNIYMYSDWVKAVRVIRSMDQVVRGAVTSLTCCQIHEIYDERVRLDVDAFTPQSIHVVHHDHHHP